MASKRLTINILGTLHIALSDEPVVSIESDKGRALLVYLAVESDRSHTREALATLLWPETEPRTGRKNLRQALYNLRKAIESEEATTPYLLITRGDVRFNTASAYALDVETFQKLYEETRRHQHRRLDACSTCIAKLEEALALFRGGFLRGFSVRDSESFEEWRLLWSETINREAAAAMSAVATYFERRRDYGRAINYLQRHLELTPESEETHARLMRAYALRGQRSAALNQYETVRAMLAREYAAEPSPETQTLYQNILSGSIAPALLELESPYKGLNAFTSEDAEDFYGREALTESLIQAVNEQHFVVLIGSSGSGKSSLIQAGLIPHLEALATAPSADTMSEGLTSPWLIVDFRPGSEPYLSLAESLAHMLPSPVPPADLARQLREEDSRLVEIAEEIGRAHASRSSEFEAAPPARLLLIVDQFEELFTLTTETSTRQAFIQMLLRPSPDGNAPSPTTLASMRADFIGQALIFRCLADAIQQHALLVRPMDRDELEQAIVEPARGRGVVFEAGLVERLLDDISQESGNLPLLQFALSQLWDHRQQGEMTHIAYEEIGGVAGALTRYADHVYWKQLDQNERERARQIFLRLVQLGQGTEDSRRVATREELGEANWVLARKLADARLLVTNRDAEGHETVELAHEALIHNWEQYQRWLENDRTFRGWQQRLQSALRQWQISQMDDGALLRGAPLIEAERWAQSRADDLSLPELAFIHASSEYHQREEAERVAQHQRLVEQAQELAEAEHLRAEAETKAKNRFRLLSIGLGLALLVVIVAASFAFSERLRAEFAATTAREAQVAAEQAQEVAEQERRHAKETAQRALSRQLAAQALNLVDSDLDLALLLSLESLNLAQDADKTDLLTRLRISPLVSNYLHGPPAAVYELAFDSEHRRLVSLTGEQEITAWENARGVGSALTLDTEEAPDNLVISPTGRVAVVVFGAAIRFYDVDGGRPLSDAITVHEAPIKPEIFFSRDGQTLLTTDENGVKMLWDVANGAALGPIAAGADVSAKAISPDGATIVMDEVIDDVVNVFLWDVAENRPATTPTPAHTATLHEAIFSPDGRFFATASFDGSARIWDAATGQAWGQPLIGHNGRVLSVAFSPDGQILATGGTDNRIMLWDVASGAALGNPLTGHKNWIRSLTFSPDGRTLASGDESGHIIIWNVSAQKLLRAHHDRVRSVALSPDGDTLLSESFDGTLGVWDAQTGELEQLLSTPHNSTIISIAFSPDGKTFATGDAAGVVVLWDAATLTPRGKPLQGHSSVVVGLAFSPDGSRLATGAFDGLINLWDVASGAQLTAPVQGHNDWTLSLAFSPDGKILASGGKDEVINLWDANTLTLLAGPLTGHTGWVTSLAFAPNGKTLVSGSSDHSVRFWDIDSGQEVGQPLLGHDAQVWGVFFRRAEAGDVLVTLGADGSVLWWDMQTRVPLRPPLLIGRETENMAISPGGDVLYFGTFNDTVVMERVSTESWQTQACAIANRNLSDEEWRAYLDAEPRRQTCPGLPPGSASSVNPAS